MMKQILVLLMLSFYTAINAQNNIYEPDLISSNLHQSNIGKITFMNGNIPLEQYKETDFLKSFDLKYKSDLNIRVFMDNSVVNYLHQLAPELPAEQLLKMGNLQFSFYVDNQFIYKENIHFGCNFGSGGNKNTSTTFRVPLTSSKGEDWWAIYMWDRFKNSGGEKVLTEGTHQLKIEIKPYIDLDGNKNIKTGNLIAEGQVKLVIKTPQLTAKQIEVQPIQPNSDWEISTLPFNKKKIELLNTAIGNYSLKEITSIVVIREGKLMLEEYFNDADRNTLHDTRSATKSFTSTFMGMAIKDGYIKDENQTLNKFYDLKHFAHYEPKKDSIKIKDLLTMSSAFAGSDSNSESPGNEENMYPTDNWVKFTLDLPIDELKTNGAQWDYFTAGVVLLGDIINKSVPNGLENYAAEKLFKPLNITQYKWQYTPQNVVNTAGSMQMTSLEYAKYAQLYKNNGVWNGSQLIPADWIQKTFTKQIQIPQRDQEYYGYLFWNKSFLYQGKNYEAFYCAGNGGNVFIVFKDLPLVVIITSKAYGRAYGHPQAAKIINEYLLPAVLN